MKDNTCAIIGFSYLAFVLLVCIWSLVKASPGQRRRAAWDTFLVMALIRMFKR
jgi:nitrate reductase NapE component